MTNKSVLSYFYVLKAKIDANIEHFTHINTPPNQTRRKGVDYCLLSIHLSE